jgi:hypothetical protein
MPKTERDPLGPSFQWRIRSALDRIEPPPSAPRYATASPRAARPLRFARVGLASGITGILALTAFAATGSANPAVWTQRIVTTIKPIPVVVEPSPTPEQTPPPATRAVAPAVPAHTPNAPTSEQPKGPDAHETPEATPKSGSPEPSPGEGDHSNSGDHSHPSPSPEHR